MKILHCIPSMRGGGAERQLSYVSTELVRSGIDVHVALIYGGPNSARLEKSGAVIHKLACWNNHDPRLFVGLLGLIRSIRPNIVQTWLTQMDIFGGFAAMTQNVPFVLSERNSALSYSGTWKDRLRRFVGSRASLIVANSDAGQAYWLSGGVSPQATRVIRNAIPFNDIQAASPDRAHDVIADRDRELVVFAGRYCEQKNLRHLMAALEIVLKEREHCIALLFGKGPLKQMLEDLKARSPNGDRIQIFGYTDRLWSTLKLADVFVSVSLFEGIPNTVLEAAACRCPIVVSEISEHREFLDDSSAIFVPTSSPAKIAEGIIEALSDTTSAKARADAAFQRISQWSIGHIAGQYLEAYTQVISGRARN